MTKNNLFKIATLCCITLIIGCNNDLIEELDAIKKDIEIIKSVNSILSLKNVLLETKLLEDPILNIETLDDNTSEIVFESRQSIIVEENIIASFITDDQNWLINITFTDSTSFLTWYLGSEEAIEIEIHLNPFLSSPLAAIANIKTPIKGKFNLRVIGQNGESSDIITSFQNLDVNHELEILGLYPEYENKVELSFLSSEDVLRRTITLKILTDALPEGFPTFSIVKQYDTNEQNMVFLVNFRPTAIPFMVDRFGKIRWYSTGFSKGSKYALQRFRNGNIGFGKSGNGQGSVFEYSIMGKLIREYSFYPEFENAHHDVFEMSNGNFLIPVNKVGEPTIEDYIIELDRNSGIISNIWDLNLILPKRDTLINNAIDWVHVNAVIHDERDNSIIISGQRQGLFKVTWDNQLKWIFAPPYDWDGFEEYLLTSSDSNMEWAWGQHAPLITPKGNLFLFDNGFGRGFGTAEKFSRALEVHIVEDNKGGTVETVWEFGRERGEDFYSPIISDVDFIKSSDSRLIVAGALAFELEYTDNDNISKSWSTDILKSSIVEVDENKNVLFELHIKSEIQSSSVYRAEKIKLY